MWALAQRTSGSMCSGNAWAMQLSSIGEGDLLEVVVLVGVAAAGHGQFCCSH